MRDSATRILPVTHVCGRRHALCHENEHRCGLTSNVVRIAPKSFRSSWPILDIGSMLACIFQVPVSADGIVGWWHLASRDSPSPTEIAPRVCNAFKCFDARSALRLLSCVASRTARRHRAEPPVPGTLISEIARPGRSRQRGTRRCRKQPVTPPNRHYVPAPSDTPTERRQSGLTVPPNPAR